MSLPKPDLDNKTFNEFVEEAKKLIPIYAPEWTDYNVSDPGITFIELFAWLSEMQIYRMNQITEKNRLKFLKLLGITPRPATPAKVDVTFSLNNSYDSSVTVTKGTKVAAMDENGNNIVFETDYEINITPISLNQIISRDWQRKDNVDANNMDGHYYFAFGEKLEKGNALYLGFDKFLTEKINLMVYLYEDDLVNPGKHGNEVCGFTSSVELKWEFLSIDLNNSTSCWVDLTDSLVDDTQMLTTTGTISFTIPSTVSNDEKCTESNLTSIERNIIGLNELLDIKKLWIRCKVEKEGYDIPPRIESIQLNTVSATQGETINNERFSSDGLPDQKFTLGYRPMVAESQIISVIDVEAPENDPNKEYIYTDVKDFDGSSPEDQHYNIDHEKGEILFGNGVNGFIPPKSHEINITYRTGGGKIGNVRKGAINRIISPDFSKILVNNLQNAYGGAEKETIEEAIIRLRQDLKEPYQAVTSNDYEYLAKSTPGLRVRRAKAIPYNEKGLVKIIVVPEFLENVEDIPIPSEGFKKTVYMHLCKHRLITTQINVDEPEYVGVSISATVKLKKGFEAEMVRKRVLDELGKFLHPLKPDYHKEGWPFGRSVFKSEIYESIDDVEGVDCVSELSMENGKYSFDGKKIDIPQNALVYSKQHYITILGPEAECIGERYL